MGLGGIHGQAQDREADGLEGGFENGFAHHLLKNKGWGIACFQQRPIYLGLHGGR